MGTSTCILSLMRSVSKFGSFTWEYDSTIIWYWCWCVSVSPISMWLLLLLLLLLLLSSMFSSGQRPSPPTWVVLERLLNAFAFSVAIVAAALASMLLVTLAVDWVVFLTARMMMSLMEGTMRRSMEVRMKDTVKDRAYFFFGGDFVASAQWGDCRRRLWWQWRRRRWWFFDDFDFCFNVKQACSMNMCFLAAARHFW